MTVNRAIEEDTYENAARIEALRSALIAGEESGFVEGNPFEQVREWIRSPSLTPAASRLPAQSRSR